jgi:hypothetical protein
MTLATLALRTVNLMLEICLKTGGASTARTRPRST